MSTVEIIVYATLVLLGITLLGGWSQIAQAWSDDRSCNGDGWSVGEWTDSE